MHIRLLAVLAATALVVLPSSTHAAPAPRPTGLSLTVSPQIVDVGSEATFTLHAKKWNGPNRVTLSFLSPHHGFTGTMPWRPSCGCFQLSVILARRIHALETGRAVVKILTRGATSSTARRFQIRGLANNGHDFAPGGKTVLAAWVSDPHPNRNEYQHYCGFTRTVDGLGVAGYTVRFVAHFPSGNRAYTAGPTGKSGVACTSKSVGNIASGKTVSVQVYAGNLKATTQFRSQ